MNEVGVIRGMIGIYSNFKYLSILFIYVLWLLWIFFINFLYHFINRIWVVIWCSCIHFIHILMVKRVSPNPEIAYRKISEINLVASMIFCFLNVYEYLVQFGSVSKSHHFWVVVCGWHGQIIVRLLHYYIA